MATYKVPQDVEADDKLIGPFSFRQFIYLIIVALSGVAAWGLAQLFVGLAIIPLPIMLFFGALALPLRKDQPMEVYLAALVSFHLKPRRRMWDPDGIESLIEITVPKTVSENRTKNLTQEDAEQRFSYLASLVDSQGWAIRGTNPQMNSDILLEAQSMPDILDKSNSVAQSFDTMMTKSSEKVHEEAVQRMHDPDAFTIPNAVEVTDEPNPFLLQENDPQSGDIDSPQFNPYPTSIQQAIIQPLGDPMHSYAPVSQTHMQTTAPVAPAPVAAPIAPAVPSLPAVDKIDPVIAAAPPVTVPPKKAVKKAPSEKPLSPDIMNLANNTDLSIETIAHEAHRIHEREDQKEHDLSEEVVISLR